MMIIPTKCPQCHKAEDIEVNEWSYRRWRGGEYIQTAMPELNSTQREQLMTGICGPCWDRMFADDE